MKPGFETTAPGPDGFPVNTIDGVAENGLSGTDRDGRAGREIMLVSGAEVYRIEDTVSRILKQSGLEGIEVFALAAGIFATLSDPSISAITVVKE